METDAGDFAINDSKAAAPVITKAPSAGPAGPSFGLPPKLEPFILLAKSARGASVGNLVGQATGAPGVYVFSELLELQGIKDLAMSEQYASSYELLEIFAYGTWGDYAAKQASLPTLTKAQEIKLKQLTILSLAMENRIIPYTLLLSTLDLPSIPALEDLIIDAFYSSIFSGRLDQKEARLEVTTSLGRDVRPSPSLPPTDEQPMDLDPSPITAPQAHSIPTLASALTAWLSTIGTLLRSLDHHLASIAANAVNDAGRRAGYEQKVQEMVAEVSKAKEGKEKESNGGGWKDTVGSAVGGLKQFVGKGNVLGATSSANLGDDMEVDSGPGPATKGMKSPQGAATRAKKRGRNDGGK